MVEGKWYSIVGYMYMNSNSGAFSIWKSRKRMFFALDESENRLQKSPIGTISLVNAACTTIDEISTAISIRVGGKNYEIIAENDSCAEKWLNALQNRRDGLDQNQNIRKDMCSECINDMMSRSRSTSLPVCSFNQRHQNEMNDQLSVNDMFSDRLVSNYKSDPHGYFQQSPINRYQKSCKRKFTDNFSDFMLHVKISQNCFGNIT
ncbi:unnamed protein product [Dracunculus medinensis]|uniref:PH domain-containing protein n=1 Tax=Dracunculus medinensis TaxID=318479 RepID=A0A158Q4U2_DRAME|nr:unnamed protein product [Dracunculus medinensis]